MVLMLPLLDPSTGRNLRRRKGTAAAMHEPRMRSCARQLCSSCVRAKSYCCRRVVATGVHASAGPIADACQFSMVRPSCTLTVAAALVVLKIYSDACISTIAASITKAAALEHACLVATTLSKRSPRPASEQANVWLQKQRQGANARHSDAAPPCRQHPSNTSRMPQAMRQAVWPPQLCAPQEWQGSMHGSSLLSDRRT